MNKQYIFAIDLGGTSTKMAILKEDGTFVHKWQIPTDKLENGKNIIKNIQESFAKTLAELSLDKQAFHGVGMGAPGPTSNGFILNAVNLGWGTFPLQEELEKAFAIPAFIGNDANCAALGEMWQGAGKGLRHLICITLGTGVGGGVIVDGDIVEGVKGGAGEIGHMPIVFQDGYRCNCGKNGCLETVASATGISRIALEKLNHQHNETTLRKIYEEKGKISAKDVFDHAETDLVAKEVVQEVCSYLGISIAMLAATLNPEAVILGGGVSKAGQTLLEPVKHYYKQYAFPTTKDDTEILLATLGNDAGLYGAGWLVKKGLNI